MQRSAVKDGLDPSAANRGEKALEEQESMGEVEAEARLDGWVEGRAAGVQSMELGTRDSLILTTKLLPRRT